MPKQLDSRSRGARAARYAFATLCAGVGVLSMSDSGWALRLKAEGYYADLQAELVASQFAIAGTIDTVLAYVYNAGPEPVEQYTLLLKVDGGISLLTPECEWAQGVGMYSCVFDRPLPVNEYALHDFSLRFDEFSEGPAAIGLLATSPLHDPVPANSFTVASVWVKRDYDVRVEIDPNGARPGPNGSRLRVRVVNDGPSGALDLRVETQLSGEVTGSAPFECVTENEGFCHIPPWVDLYPNGYVELDVALPAASPSGSGYALEVRVITPADDDNNPDNNSVTFRYAVALFASGFE